MTPTHQRIINAFHNRHYMTSAQLVDVAGFRYSARLHELRKMGYDFPWGYKKDLSGRVTHTTIYTMRGV